MEKKDIYIKLNENIQNLECVENEIAMLELALYKKNIENLKDKKLNELRQIFEQQAEFYNQKTEKYQQFINANIEKYNEEIEKLISMYDNLYINIFKIMQNALSNQKIAVANIVTLIKKNEKQNNSIIACVEKKLNYSVIIDECSARIEWCIENFEKDLNDVFNNNINNLQIYKKDNIFIKIKQMIYNKISGKRKYLKYLTDYQNDYLNRLEKKNNIKIIDIMIIIKGITKQMRIVKEQITLKYNATVNA